MKRPLTAVFCVPVALCLAAPSALAAPPAPAPKGDISAAVKAVGESFDAACAQKKGVRFVLAGTDIIAKQTKKMPDPVKKLVNAVWHELYKFPDPCAADSRAAMSKFVAERYGADRKTIDGYYVAHQDVCDRGAWTIVAKLKELLTKI
ncbi:hypothetical protein [Allokutzneria albata]|uniref:Haemophore haem-binding domain-containing protein n=1 Tax=Allokutzneria albata TaxID=211114 RepID=A0A1H0D6I2_ALLAB|nr:hypothetical protein [Allokutzneria albata]SDN65699.1 hypothetical protein SAMN04489726_7611 [Allokutzneria albata]